MEVGGKAINKSCYRIEIYDVGTGKESIQGVGERQEELAIPGVGFS